MDSELTPSHYESFTITFNGVDAYVFYITVVVASSKCYMQNMYTCTYKCIYMCTCTCIEGSYTLVLIHIVT